MHSCYNTQLHLQTCVKFCDILLILSCFTVFSGCYGHKCKLKVLNFLVVLFCCIKINKSPVHDII